MSDEIDPKEVLLDALNNKQLWLYTQLIEMSQDIAEVAQRIEEIKRVKQGLNDKEYQPWMYYYLMQKYVHDGDDSNEHS